MGVSSLVVSVALLLGITGHAAPAAAFELLAWWQRGLLEVQLTPGDWVRYAVLEIGEEGALTDTLTVTVLAPGEATSAATPNPDTSLRWLRIESAPDEPVDYLLVDPDRLRDGDEPLDAVRRFVRREIDGTWVEEDLEEHRQSRVVRRHLEDPFDDPQVERIALADTVAQGVTLSRERVTLSETREERRPAGRSVLVIETQLRSIAQLSPQIPLVGLLEAHTTTAVTTRTERADGSGSRRAAAPLLDERSLRCTAFGRLDPVPDCPVPDRVDG